MDGSSALCWWCRGVGGGLPCVGVLVVVALRAFGSVLVCRRPRAGAAVALLAVLRSCLPAAALARVVFGPVFVGCFPCFSLEFSWISDLRVLADFKNSISL